MPLATQVLEQLQKGGLEIDGLNPDGETLKYKWVVPQEQRNAKLLDLVKQNKPLLVKHFALPFNQQPPTLLERARQMQEGIQEGNEAINKRLEPDPNKHPILDFLYPKSVTAKALMSIPAAVTAATGVGESIAGGMALGAGVGAAAGAASGEGTLGGAAQGLLSGIRLPGSKASEKAIAADYDRGINQAVVNTLGYLPKTTEALMKKGAKWWDVVRQTKWDNGNTSIAQSEAGRLYEKGMFNIQKKFADWGKQHAQALADDWEKQFGFNPMKKSTPEAAAAMKDNKDMYAALTKTRSQIFKYQNLAPHFGRTVKNISNSLSGVYEDMQNAASNTVRGGRAPALIRQDAEQKEAELMQLLDIAEKETGEPLTSQFKQVKDQYSKFKGIQDMADHIVETRSLRTVKPGDVRTRAQELMEWAHIKRGPLAEKLKDAWPGVEKSILRGSDFAKGMDVEGKEGGPISARLHVPGVPAWIHAIPGMFKRNPTVRVGDLPHGKIPPWLATQGGKLLGGELGQAAQRYKDEIQTPAASPTAE